MPCGNEHAGDEEVLEVEVVCDVRPIKLTPVRSSLGETRQYLGGEAESQDAIALRSGESALVQELLRKTVSWWR